METKIYKIELQVSEIIAEELLNNGILAILSTMAKNLFANYQYNDDGEKSLDAEKALQIISTIKQTEDILKQIRLQQHKENSETTSDLCKDVLDDAS